MIKGRTSARAMIADRRFRFEDDDLAMLGKPGCRGQASHPTADHDDVG